MDRSGFVVGPSGGFRSAQKRDVSVCTVAEKLAGLAFIATSIALGTALAQNGAFIGATKLRTCLSCKGKGEVKCPVCNGAAVVKTQNFRVVSRVQNGIYPETETVHSMLWAQSRFSVKIANNRMGISKIMR
ncbi:hypothetical protein NDN08_007862 [Rhodosorus marinus]|uniref:Uncharacterized protein n=1 Tax=Rhodosorus marinus TaxID=101924 RepID=A0AAV8V2C5_9RHOD|nr:hypothetical protein NDN08_007862 [Rhodosorus marinus]